VARKVYMNVYLFEKGITPLAAQKHNRELEIIVQECILTAVRESVPTEEIIRAYLDESIDQEEEVVIENITEPVVNETSEINSSAAALGATTIESDKEKDVIPDVVPSIRNIDEEPTITRLTFNDFDSAIDMDNKEELVNAPKTIERLEQISTERAFQRKLEEEEEEMEDRIKISTDTIDLNDLGIMDLEGNSLQRNNDLISLDDIIELN